MREHLVAHRGYAQRFPENTLESLVGALETGVRYVEFDIQLTRDRIPVLLHDADLERTAGRAGKVFDLTLAELADYDVNESARLGDAFSGVRVAPLTEAIATLAEYPGRRAFVEIKRESLQRFGRTQVLDTVLTACGAAPTQCILISFDVEVLRRALRRPTVLPQALVVSGFDRANRSALCSLGPEFVFCNHLSIPAGAELWPGDWRWVLYDIGDPELATEWFARGTDLIETMAVEDLLTQATLGNKGIPSDE